MSKRKFSAALAFSIGLAIPAGVVLAHSYDNSGSEPNKVIDGPVTVTEGTKDGVDGYYIDYTRFTYQDISEHYHAYELALQEIEKAYCKAPGEFGANDDIGVACGVEVTDDGRVVSKSQSQDTLYGGDVSPHAQGMRYPNDRKEFASYLSAATGGFNNGQGGNLAQANAVPGSRLAQIKDQKALDAASARMYAFQFAAAAKGYDPGTIEGMAKGAIAFYQMAPSAQQFMQVAAVYKGNLAANAGNYNNNTLRNLLRNAGANDLANRNNVGNNDVETLGAIAAALDRDAITLDDIANSGAIGDQGKYAKAVDMVNSGSLALRLAEYDRTAYDPNNKNRGNLNANTGNAGFNAPGANVNQNPNSLADYYGLFSGQPKPSRAQRLADQDPVFRALLEHHDLNGQGRIYGEGEAQNFVASMRCFSELLQDGARSLDGLSDHDRNHLVAFDVNGDGTVDDQELKDGLKKTEIFIMAVAADALEQTGGLAPGGDACSVKKAAPTPTPPPTPKPPCGGYGQPPC